MKRFALVVLLWAHSGALAQEVVTTPEPARTIVAPRVPLPSEAATAGVTKFSFIAYGDTRGRHDGVGAAGGAQARHRVDDRDDQAREDERRLDPLRPPERRRGGERLVRQAVDGELRPAHRPPHHRRGRPVLPLGREPRRRQRHRPRRRAPRRGAAQLLLGERGADPAEGVGAAVERLSDVRVRLRKHVLHRGRLGHPRRLGAVRLGDAAARGARPPRYETSCASSTTRRSRRARTAARTVERQAASMRARWMPLFRSTTCACCSRGTSTCSSTGSSDGPTRRARTASTRS